MIPIAADIGGLLGGILGGVGATSGLAVLLKVRSDNRRADAEAKLATSRAGSESEVAEAATIRSIVDGANSVLLMRQRQIEDFTSRLQVAEETIKTQQARLAECEKQIETIDPLTQEVIELRRRHDAQAALADRYRRERNEVRDDLRETRKKLDQTQGELHLTKQELRNAEDRIDELERQVNS